ncbi:MAG: hypothetical protein Q8P12_02425, partial [bacterium]|nr:hypothetical protein [bacterium]
AATQREELAKKAFEAGRAAHPDFDDVVEEAGDVVITDPMDYAILRSEHPGEILYRLANNPEEAQRIAGLPDADVFLEIGRLDARLGNGNAQPDKTNGAAGGAGRPTEKLPEVSKAPPPPKSVGGSVRSGKTIEYYANTASPEEFRKAVLGKEI